ncbi:DeoR/GlpR family DNA-binding transcription regulator [Neobacillus cucumis]|uniref:DeoR/GlpR family DNA-binding transcription regulator n=1 Tax=Neobacillus cucumis TaxID=1740721 RepID=UPI002E1FCC09|nr:DeoR/GlpR family DNA-binding transcription regulator [Neobacillus cucumis]
MKIDRHNEILNILREKGSSSISELCALVFSSPATMRRDLSYLEKRGYIKRYPGGASILERPFEMPFDLRNELNNIQKNYLAQIGMSFIKDGQLLFFDSSTTCIKLGQQLGKFKNLKIVTNGTVTSQMLSRNLNLTVYSTGGKVSPKTLSLLGTDAHQFISNYHADIFFCSCRGLTSYGACESSAEEAEIKRFFAKHSNVTVLMVDSSKYNQNYHHIGLRFEDIDFIVSDTGLPENIVNLLDSNHYKTKNIFTLKDYVNDVDE